jgi:hypothetical protein
MYALVKYRVKNPKDNNAKSQSNNKKEPNDRVMESVWKLMKYTQGENEQKITMKLQMPVFVCIETITDNIDEKLNDDEELIEVKVMISLPPEYQSIKSEKPLEPPVPNDKEIVIEEAIQMKCYVRLVISFIISLYRNINI